MTSFLERYLNGEHEQVWAELFALGDQVRAESLFPDAYAVAQETMRRAKTNIERIVARLSAMGYTFRAASAYEAPKPDVENRIADLERLVGAIPLSLRAWYEVVGMVNLMGEYAGWIESDDEGYLKDPLVVLPIEEVLQDYALYRDEDDYTVEDSSIYQLGIAPDEFFKEDVSGGGDYFMEVPNATADAPLEEWHQTTFVDYLRICFQWGGFPGFERFLKHQRPTKILTYLTENLLPI